MPAFNKFNQFVEDVAAGVHNLKTGTTHVFKVMLTNTAPVATNSIKSDITELSAGSGYTAGGNTATFTSGAQTSGTFKLTLADPATWTNSGTLGPFRYAVLYNDTPTSPLKPLIGWVDYGSSITITVVGETFTVDLDQTNGVLTIT